MKKHSRDDSPLAQYWPRRPRRGQLSAGAVLCQIGMIESVSPPRALVLKGPTGAGKTLPFVLYGIHAVASGAVKRVIITGPRELSKWPVLRDVALVAAKRGPRICKKHGMPRLLAMALFSKARICQYARDSAKENKQAIPRGDIEAFCEAMCSSKECPYWTELVKVAGEGDDLPPHFLERARGKFLVVAELALLKQALPQSVLKKIRHVVFSASEHNGKLCAYYVTRRLLKHVQIAIMDYNYLLRGEIRRATLERGGVNLLDKKTLVVYDEGPDALKRAEDSYELHLSKRTVDAALREIQGEFIPRRKKESLDTRYAQVFSKETLSQDEAEKFVRSVGQAMALVHGKYEAATTQNRYKYHFKKEEWMKAIVGSVTELTRGIDLKCLSRVRQLSLEIIRFKHKHHLGARSHLYSVCNFLRYLTSQYALNAQFLRYYVADTYPIMNVEEEVEEEK